MNVDWLKNKKTWTMYGGIIGLIAIIFFSFPEPTTTIDSELSPTASKQGDPFAGIVLDAKAAFVYDIADETVLFAKNENQALPIASITKVMTAVVAAESAPNSTVVSIDPESLDENGDSGLLGNERWSLSRLLSFMLVSSSNDGAAAVASSLGSITNDQGRIQSRDSFVTKMNDKAQAMGLSKTQYFNESGLDVSTGTPGALSSAKDTALLLSYAISKHPEILAPTRYPTFSATSLDNFSHSAENTDTLAGTIAGLIAGKTGYTTLAGGTLAIVFDAGLNHPVAVVVLGSSYDGRFTDIRKLVDGAIEKIAIQ